MKFILVVTNSKGPVIFRGRKGTNTRGELTFYSADGRTSFETTDVLLWQECATAAAADQVVEALGLGDEVPG
ncbi:hypothetical protein [Verrucomicrobium sp. BvORR106]|uniref:hypothetical protein n=1 Tax=Verrucomicrobium sp. BvORR106 TaxID=1403819 RepID=UPI00057008DA|nr:hypothetical protein [Verrucomicrobium sp. BvORR106]